MVPRLTTIQNNYSFFLFGPRGSGKSTLLKAVLEEKKPVWIDLLDPDEEAIFQTDPNELTRRTSHLLSGSWVVIDEVQKAPKLLDLAHKLIEEKKIYFALSGSSARKLKRGGANLLAGRAFVRHLYPFTSLELKEMFDLQKAMEWGMLPKICEFDEEENKKRFLQAYANTYLKEEIQAEQIARNLPGFRKFLEVAAQMNGQPVNYSKIGRDIHTDHSVVKNYFEILKDTLIGFELTAYDISIRKQQRKAPKFYFIDCGIKRALDKSLDIPLRERTYEYGQMFEHLLILELFKLCQYRERDESLHYLQTKDNVEVDLVIKRPGKPSLFIDIKSTKQVSDTDFRSILEITDGLKEAKALLISNDPNKKSAQHVEALHWQTFLELFQENKV
ncbi:MAG: ATP-binding protein [Deltaproteobacteria bacterium]|nr:ATP-binding protein [Deltaproteobacteria bacterium]